MAAPEGGRLFNLNTLVKRLEAATSRLEDIASSATSIEVGPDEIADGSKHASGTGETLGLARSAPVTGPQTTAASKEPLPPSIDAFDALVEEELKAFSDLAEKLEDPITKSSKCFCDAFIAQRDVLLVASKARDPGMTLAFSDILKDVSNGIEAVGTVRDTNRKSPAENHLAMLADGSGVLQWLAIKPKPDVHVHETLGGAQFYGNKVMTAFKGKDTQDIPWVKSFVILCGALISYIKEHYPKGIEWNDSGVSIEEAFKEVKSKPKVNGTAAPAAGGPPPPPPPPLPQFDNTPAPSKSGSGSPPAGDMGAVFADLNRGESVTSGLKKVDKSEMTHKNPSLRAQGSAPALERSDSSTCGRGKSPQPPIKKKPDSMRTKKPPKKELEGNKWIVENYENEQTPIEINAEKHQSILITKCKGATLKVNGKANAISLDNCSKTDMLIESLVSSVDVINSSNFRLQVTGSLPSIQMDKVDVATVFLSPESLHTEVYTSKCSSINITLPPAGDQDDSVECPVPEQIKTIIVDGKLVNEIVKQEG